MIDTAVLLMVVALAAPANSAGHAPTPTDSIVAGLVSGQVGPGDMLRVQGGFGQVQARASTIGPRGLVLQLTPNGLTDPAPVRALSWSEIARIEWGEDHRKDGRRIGVVVGAFAGFALTMSAISNPDSGEASFAIIWGLAAGVGGAFVGRSLGGAVGAGIRHWKLVYERR